MIYLLTTAGVIATLVVLYTGLPEMREGGIRGYLGFAFGVVVIGLILTFLLVRIGFAG